MSSDASPRHRAKRPDISNPEPFFRRTLPPSTYEHPNHWRARHTPAPRICSSSYPPSRWCLPRPSWYSSVSQLRLLPSSLHSWTSFLVSLTRSCLQQESLQMHHSTSRRTAYGRASREPVTVMVSSLQARDLARIGRIGVSPPMYRLKPRRPRRAGYGCVSTRLTLRR